MPSNDSVNDVILKEILEMRRDVNENFRTHGERLATMETQISGLVGNGQPGLIDKMQDDIEGLKKFKYWLSGALAVAETVGHYAAKKLNIG